ncbi:MAG TPA: saccharopine dehydrogenase [Flavobacteriales bacterium]|jgi:saccharopine dehydrogenase-like NADP-dependent oxidoreductase|nr:saccharopine dehydrogenase [Flavobacteriales bacterium]HHZ96971.1 saccharopine dehydrogenase [Flavobacteriales bacterium]HIB78301.1 saccharopine dehydrogenase [Flavobacteriales bacterium]HIN41927.1 saccharopine dehydrogenase [Flavobacteriales bacterium]HIO16635.1 saccharopine dehydrogenase [Flavobacteriales bacterium]
MKVTVLGAGLVGAPMAFDLALDEKMKVKVADFSPKNLNKFQGSRIETVEADLSDESQLLKVIADADLVLCAVPGFMGFTTLKSIIMAGKNVVDISFFPEDALELNDLAVKHDVTAIVDIGVAPGMSNILPGYVDSILDQTSSILIYVGGLPKVRELPYEYKAVFSPIDVIEEYTRPARYIENSVLITKPALSEPELLHFDKVGTLETFNSDGIRSLAKTMTHVPNIKEKTLRYPGHIRLMEIMREAGFFSSEPTEVNGVTIRPIDLTAKLLFPQWELKPGEVDFTIMRIEVEGVKDRKNLKYTYSLFDEYCPSTKVHSMARTTGYTATTVLRMLSEGLYDEKGIIVPEYLGKHHKCVEYILNGLKERGVNYDLQIDEL